MNESTKRTRRPKHTLEQVSEYFAEHGCTLLSKVYTGTKQNLKYRCNTCSQISYVQFNNFTRGTRCRRCFLRRRQSGKTLQKVVLRNSLLSMTDMANILGVKYDDFRRHVKEKGTLPEPTEQYTEGKKKYYSQADIAKIRNMIYLDEDKE